MSLSFNAFKNYFKVSNAWMVQPQTVEKKIHAPLTSPNLAEKNNNHTLVNILLHFCFITFFVCKNLKESQTQCLLISSTQS